MSEIVNAAHDDNQTNHFSSLGVIGTLGTADAAGQAKTLPFAVDGETGAAYTRDLYIEAVQELLSRLAPLASIISNTQQIRAVVTGAVTATGGGYITSAQEVAALLTLTNSLISHYRLEHNNILPVLANINNAVAA